LLRSAYQKQEIFNLIWILAPAHREEAEQNIQLQRDEFTQEEVFDYFLGPVGFQIANNFFTELFNRPHFLPVRLVQAF
jgi:hypothetical protein